MLVLNVVNDWNILNDGNPRNAVMFVLRVEMSGLLFTAGTQRSQQFPHIRRQRSRAGHGPLVPWVEKTELFRMECLAWKCIEHGAGKVPVLAVLSLVTVDTVSNDRKAEIG